MTGDDGSGRQVVAGASITHKMSPFDDYELLDFGRGRKLERFGSRIVDRPAPAVADAAIRSLELWREAIRFERRDAQRGVWVNAPADVADWTISFDEWRLELRLAPSGQVGVFPEQSANWRWIAEQIASAGRPLSVLNLFAYTGASTLAAARAGASVVHVDAARSAVAWARVNAQRSELADAPIRWIVDDARKFVQRELERGRGYDAVILDPPSYGHGPSGLAWQVNRDLPGFLADCIKLLRGRGRFALASCHSPGWDAKTLTHAFCEAAAKNGCRPSVSADTMDLRRGDRVIPSGVVARCQIE